MSWSWQELMDAPAWVVDNIVAMMRAEAAVKRREANASRSKARRR